MLRYPHLLCFSLLLLMAVGSRCSADEGVGAAVWQRLEGFWDSLIQTQEVCAFLSLAV